MSMVKCSQLSPVVKFSINVVMVILVQIQIFLLPKNETVNYAVAESFNNLDKDLILFVSGKYFQGELTLGTKLCFSTYVPQGLSSKCDGNLTLCCLYSLIPHDCRINE